MMISDTGVSPVTAPHVGEYWFGQGGIYAGIMPDYSGRETRHLIFSIDEATNIKWGGYLVAEDNARSSFNGAANTWALATSALQHPAAQWAYNYEKDGHADFYLPSRREWEFAAATIPDAFVHTSWYWSSTEYSPTMAWGINLDSADLAHLFKTCAGRARAVRTVPV